MSDSETVNETVKTKDPRRVAAGKKGAEARKRNAELRRKETDTIKKENMKLKSITRDDDDDVQTNKQSSQNINYIPLCITIAGVVGLGFYIYKSNSNKQIQTYIPPVETPIKKEKQIDPFEFN